jgi:2-methylcitrate dehydratase PrpD
MATALLRGRLTSQEYNGAPWVASEVKSVMAKIELVEDRQYDAAFDTQGILGVRLVAELTDGRKEEILVHQPKGHPDAPLSDVELLEKITWLLEGLTPAQTAKKLLDRCSRLSTVEDVKQLIETCNLAPS